MVEVDGAERGTVWSVARQKLSSCWSDKLEEAGMPSGPINTIDKAFADSQVEHLGSLRPCTDRTAGIRG
jgi:crotonobetainyl-CoA:carnitine CoA-transferase CaiB-like acyl-CoA transferase